MIRKKFINTYFIKKKRIFLNILKKKFYFERRGFNYSGANVFLKPIFEVSKKIYVLDISEIILKKDIRLKKKRLSKKQIQAFNYLDKLLKKESFTKNKIK